MMIFGRTQPLAHYPILECLPVLHRLGFDGVELCMENNDLAPDVVTPHLIATIRERATTLFGTYSVGYHKDYIYDDALFELTKRAIVLTPDFGAGILIFSGTHKRTGDAAEWQRMIERTRVLVDIAADHDVVLAQEFEPGFIVGSTADLLRLFDEIPSPHLAANLDLGHVFLCDPDPMVAIRRIGDKIVHCHVENMARGVHDHQLPQEGDMDLGVYIKTLAEVNFTGGLALDLYKYDYEAVATTAIAYLRQLIE
jgi:sugar phosphate isomerase/epimerase